jgi:HAMP domain-containing protein
VVNADVAALAYHTVTEPLGHVQEQVAAHNKSVLTASSAEAARDRVLVVALMLLALGLAGGVGTIVTRAITSRLRRTMAVLEQVAKGDLTKRIDVGSSDEVAEMGAALNLALDRVEERARGQRFESRLANALDMADNEAEVLAVIERSFESTVPESAIELLLADNSHAHLHRVAAASSQGGPPGCSVGSPDHCPAARRAPGAALRRQRSPRRLPQTARPFERPLSGCVRACGDYGAHRRGHARHHPA